MVLTRPPPLLILVLGDGSLTRVPLAASSARRYRSTLSLLALMGWLSLLGGWWHLIVLFGQVV